MSRISRRLVSTGALDVVATAAPGIKDILILGKVKQLERAGVADLIVLDAPAAGHAITFLQSARALLDTVKVGPINTQAREVLELLEDHARCQVILVTLPEETPVNELVDTAFHLEDRVGRGARSRRRQRHVPRAAGARRGPRGGRGGRVRRFVPGEAEALAGAAEFRRSRMALQAEQVARLAERLPLPQLHLPFQFTTDIGARRARPPRRRVAQRRRVAARTGR